jgi:hypothetical protein
MDRAPPYPPRLLTGAVLGFAGVLLAACGGPQSESAVQTPAAAAASAAEAGYLAPPSLASATREGGRLVLTGLAPPGSRVQLASPDGRVLAVDADRAGAWSLSLPAPAAPAMFAFSAQAGPRIVRGEGAVLLPPAPAPAALLLRPGFGAFSLGPASDVPVIVAIDYDASGGAAVAGLAPPSTPVRLSLDGDPAGVGQTDAQGRFAVIAANRTLAPGARVVEVETAAGPAEVRINVSPAAPLNGTPYRATAQATGWRIDWAPPGGGVQTTLVFAGQGARP